VTLKPDGDGPLPEQVTHSELSEASLPSTESSPTDEATQEAYRKAYLEQLRRQSCPGCGEDFSAF
jgi:hypothetical protein